MTKISEAKLAKSIAELEGGKQNLSIAQIKEVQKILLDKLAEEWTSENEEGVIKLIKNHRTSI